MLIHTKRTLVKIYIFFSGLLILYLSFLNTKYKQITCKEKNEKIDIWPNLKLEYVNLENYNETNLFETQQFKCKKFETPGWCKGILNHEKETLTLVEKYIEIHPKQPINMMHYSNLLDNCTNFKKIRNYSNLNNINITYISYAINIFKDFEQVERLIRALYQSSTLFCIHVDSKSSLIFHNTVHKYAKCFENIFVASTSYRVKWGDASVLMPDIVCMSDLLKLRFEIAQKYPQKAWKYLINLTGQEFPLKTNLQISQYLNLLNGSNDITGSQKRFEMDRIKYEWNHEWSEKYQQLVLVKSKLIKEKMNLNITFYKGDVHGIFTYKMVEFIVHDKKSKDYLKYIWNTGHASEHYWNVLNYNQYFNVPGGYMGPNNMSEEYSVEPTFRLKHWIGLNHIEKKCHGKIVRGLCIFGIGDLHWLINRRELFVNKFHLTYQSLALDCLEMWLKKETCAGSKLNFSYNSPIIKFSRKDGCE
ncbi:hypothetical protein A3Q56_03113 [Intoshia linei]|uniref:Protein xylosyltransferase n=1 Tax=Intoshia linei TaxID=1819745 RepID=A0A177B6W2_9BILA|nr:hypothetical protein A3Q56_03113 [Intoshia linei]